MLLVKHKIIYLINIKLALMATEYPTVPVSALPIRSLASGEAPANRPTDNCSGIKANKQNIQVDSEYFVAKLDGSSSLPLVPVSAKLCTHIPVKSSPPKIQPIDDSPETNPKIVNSSERTEPTKLRPDTFISVRISSPALLHQLSAVQSEMNQSDPSIARSIISPSTFHLTLLTLHTGDTMDNLNTAIKIIQRTLDNYKIDILNLSFRGLNQFSNKVLFVSLLKDKNFDIFSGLARSLSEIFTKEYTSDFDEVLEFTPHLTLAKTSKTARGPHKHRLYEFKNPDSINRIISKYSDCLFGTERIDSIELLAMNKPKSADGYYHCYQTFKF